MHMQAERRFRLRELRLDQAISQAELAKRAGLTRPTITMLENGHHAPSYLTQRRLARALDIEVSRLWDARPMTAEQV